MQEERILVSSCTILLVLLAYCTVKSLSKRSALPAFVPSPSPSQQSADRTTDVAVLFTMYNTEERQNMTIDVLNFYAADLVNFCMGPIPRSSVYIVDSSNNGVPTGLVAEANQVVFDQRLYCDLIGPVTGPTYAELCSLNLAFDKIDFAKRGHTHVIKLTAKYKIPNLDTLVLDKIHPDAELILQYSNDVATGYQNTEILGFKISRIQEILADLADATGDLESRLAQLVKSDNYFVQRLDPLPLDRPFYPRSDGSILSSLKSHFKTQFKEHKRTKLR